MGSYDQRLLALNDSKAAIQGLINASADPGRVNFFRDASASFDAYTKAPTDAQKKFMDDNYHRMRVYSPYFDTRTSWYSRGVVYQDSYAIYTTNDDRATLHKEWILKDASGAPMFIPYGAKPYTQYAADITNPAYRADWIARTRAKFNHGYRGIFIDDVNYARRVATATGDETVTPVGAAGQISATTWKIAMANFMAEIRQAFPAPIELIQNAVWSVPETIEMTYGYRQADWIEIEHGVIDGGITGGTGKYALRTLLAWIDRRHSAGVNVIFDSLAATTAQYNYGLAVYYLTSSGQDMLGSRTGGTPDDFWPGYRTMLGKPLGAYTVSGTLLSRKFERGTVYVNEPGAAAVTVGTTSLAGGNGLIVPA